MVANVGLQSAVHWGMLTGKIAGGVQQMSLACRLQRCGESQQCTGRSPQHTHKGEPARMVASACRIRGEARGGAGAGAGATTTGKGRHPSVELQTTAT